jgi:hypothetical protein
MAPRRAAVLDAVMLAAPAAIAATKRSFLAANGLTLDARAFRDARSRGRSESRSQARFPPFGGGD